ncbi:MAG: TetR/AcrR family transcriptional regulator [Candidatus Heimdallarchaeota archaeon]|nr:TetR/AcrR family transcriptional regulator [Candidatus Heimdallarchaeota archaeon]
MKKSIYRKGEAREEQLLKIIDQGRKMFTSEPLMSMNELAKRVGLSGASSLYRYIVNKRELWFAIMLHDFDLFIRDLQKIIDDPKMVSYKEILLEMCRHYLKLSRDDFPRFKIMLLIEPPHPIPKSMADRGPFEKDHEPQGFTIYMNILEKAQNAGEIRTDVHPFALTGIVWSMLLGAAASVSPLYDYLGKDFLTKNYPMEGDPRITLHEQMIQLISVSLSDNTQQN